MVYGDAENYEDNLLFSYHSSLFSNYRNLVSEYRNISRLIDEVDRCADMKSRDILAINEITKVTIFLLSHKIRCKFNKKEAKRKFFRKIVLPLPMF
jgi:hypothetical protein